MGDGKTKYFNDLGVEVDEISYKMKACLSPEEAARINKLLGAKVDDTKVHV